MFFLEMKMELIRDENGHVHMPGAHLEGAYLEYAILRDADFECADLACSNLRGADMRGADMRDAILRGADMRDADMRDANIKCAFLSRADLRGAKLPPAPVIPDIHRRVYEAATATPDSLDMGYWHTCETTHCRAGWVVHLAGPEGYALEAKYGTGVAAALIYMASDPSLERIPDWYVSDRAARADMKRLAGEQMAGIGPDTESETEAAK